MGVVGPAGAPGLHIDVALTNLSVQYKPLEGSLIGLKLFPAVNVSKQSDQYYVFDKEAFRVYNSRLEKHTYANVVTRRMSLDNYRCDGHGLRDVITVAEEAASDLRSLQVDSMEFLMNSLQLEHEQTVATMLTTQANYNANVVGTPATKWGQAGDTPFQDIWAAKRAVRQFIGMDPNTIIFSPTVWDVWKELPEVREKYMYVSAESYTPAIAARQLEVDNVYVAKAMTLVDAKPSAPGSQLQDFWNGDDVVLMYVPPSPHIRRPATGYTFQWTPGGAVGGKMTGTWFEPGLGGVRGAHWIEQDWYYDVKRVGVDAAGLFIAGFLYHTCL